nr:hypothetical protein [Tanacetum cinerariifolium]
NANPFVPVPPNRLHARITQEINEFRAISAMIDSHLENIDHTPPNEIDLDDLESEDELIDTPLISPFLDSNDESNDEEVLNDFRKFVAYFNPFLPVNIIMRKAYNTIMVEGLESTGRNLVVIVRDVYVFVGSFTYVTDFVIYKPTNNNLRTSSNSKNKNVDTTPQYKNDDHSGQFGTQRTLNVDVARENVGSKVVQLSGIQCFNCKEFRHFAKECRKPKRVMDFTYHKEKMMLLTLSFPSHKDHRKSKEEDEMKMRKNIRERNKLKTKDLLKTREKKNTDTTNYERGQPMKIPTLSPRVKGYLYKRK